MSELEALARMAASRKFSLLETCDLGTVGLEPNAVTRLVRAGDLTRVARGWYVVGPATWFQRVAAATLKLGCPSAVSHRSAARLHNLWSSEDIDLTIRKPHDARLSGVGIHRSVDLVNEDVEMIDGLWVTTVARTLVDLGLVLPPTEVRRLVEHAIATGLVEPAELVGVRKRVSEHGRTGVGAIDAALEKLPDVAHMAESGPEVRLLSLIERTGMPRPVPQFEVSCRGHRYRIDLAYPKQKIAIEYDGEAWHSTPAQLAADQRRQRHLESAGWRVLRYQRADLYRPDNGGILWDIRCLLDGLEP